MKSKLFDMVLYESTYSGMEQVTSEKELKTLLDMGCTVYAGGTGPFGEDKGAKVTDFGKVKDLRNKMKGIEWVMDEEGYDEDADIGEWFADCGDVTVVVLDQVIGQEPCNWYDLSSHSISDLDLWTNKDEVVEKVSKSGSGIIGTWGTNTLPDGNKGPCPNCGGESFRYIKLPMNVMHGADYVLCKKCGVMYPYFPWKEEITKNK